MKTSTMQPRGGFDPSLNGCRKPLSARFLAKLERLLEPLVLSGGSVVDIGNGAREDWCRWLVEKYDCQMTLIEPNTQLLDEARKKLHDLEVRYLPLRAEDTTLEAGHYNLCSAVQSWAWLQEQVVIPKILRALRPKGALVIIHTDWSSSGRGDLVNQTESLISQFNSDFNTWRRLAKGTGIYSCWAPRLRESFKDLETLSLDVPERYDARSWFGRVHATPFVHALNPAERNAFSVQLEKLLDPHAAYEVVHTYFALLARK